jgi:cytochrome P450
MTPIAWLRANNPLGIARPERFDPFWVVTKHAHIQAVSRQNDLFHNADRPTTLAGKAFEERVRRITGTPWCARWSRWMRPTIRNTGR